MGDVMFYHLTQSSAAETLRALLPRAVERGWQVELRCPDTRTAEALDADLWLGPEDGFLPHGVAGGPYDADQPVLLSVQPVPARACLMTVGGVEVAAEEAKAAERVCILFDGHDNAAVEAARGQWRTITGAGLTAQYWAQEGTRWQKKAES